MFTNPMSTPQELLHEVRKLMASLKETEKELQNMVQKSEQQEEANIPRIKGRVWRDVGKPELLAAIMAKKGDLMREREEFSAAVQERDTNRQERG